MVWLCYGWCLVWTVADSLRSPLWTDSRIISSSGGSVPPHLIGLGMVGSFSGTYSTYRFSDLFVFAFAFSTLLSFSSQSCSPASNDLDKVSGGCFLSSKPCHDFLWNPTNHSSGLSRGGPAVICSLHPPASPLNWWFLGIHSSCSYFKYAAYQIPMGCACMVVLSVCCCTGRSFHRAIILWPSWIFMQSGWVFIVWLFTYPFAL